MYRTTGFMLLGFLLLASCRKNNETKVPPEGTYTGTFTRVGLILSQPESVKITFNGNNFNGERNETSHICNGTYEITGDSVDFHNACLFTANIDESMVLAGKYKIVIEGDSLFISRMYLSSSSYSDTYMLKKQ
jgi:hypothetical protein